jgi:RNA recognition motif-containing protein
LAGKVLHVELGKDKDGKSRGFGVVEYDHPVESVQAISMLHNQQLYDRRMTVRLDRANEPDMPPKLPEGTYIFVNLRDEDMLSASINKFTL